ncbi:MAG TPA: hypothetical protein VFG51_00900 [Candidatus Saccharimonadia bacterium]|nr:hypothetical protein [Candidatus Saccharimonadia bacterium]
MPHNSENPCIGCISQRTGHRAPCCWGLTRLELTAYEYRRDFAGKAGVTVVGMTNDEWSGEGVAVAMPDACVNLDTRTGLCTIQDHKPKACIDLIPFVSLICIKTPGGRE